MTASNPIDIRQRLFAGDGEMCALMRSHDWSQTPLGPVEQWPQSLRTTVSIMLNSRYPMFTFWGPHLVKLYNDAYRPVLGSTKHPQALGKPGPEVWPEIWDSIGPLVNQVILEGKATWSDNLPLFMHRSGYLEEVYFTFSYSPVRDETGAVAGMFCACTETTQQVLGERRLRTLRDLAAHTGEAKTAAAACDIALTTLANNPADLPFALLYLIDAQGHQLQLAGATGIASDTPASPAVIHLRQSDHPSPWPLAQVIDTATVARIDDLIPRFGALTGGLWPESPHTALILPVASPGQERPTSLLVVGISPRRALDDDYQGFLELVARQVAAAITDARAHEIERQRAESLAEIDRAKTIFFNNVSHEFRTPLTLMLGPLEEVLERLAQNHNGGQAADRLLLHQQLQVVHRNGLRLLKLVNTLLDFSRIEAGRIQAVYQPTDLSCFTAELASSFRSLIERAGLNFQVDCPPLPQPIYVDREMWEKIVLNLLSNAFKFTLNGQINLSLQWLEVDLAAPSPQPAVRLAISDTGIGISATELPHLFERFHRVRGAQGRSFEGTGIGLSLVQELVALHGGRVEVTSAPGQGSCFTVILPAGWSHLPADRLCQDRFSPSPNIATEAIVRSTRPVLEEAWRWLPETTIAAEDPVVSIPESIPTFAGPPPDSDDPIPRILVADDNADMRSYLRRLLANHYQVDTVPDGMAALAAISQHRPDLVLTDIMMPRLDGLGLLQRLRQNPATQDLPVVLLSARAGSDDRVEGLEATADDYLTKPFSAKELLACIQANLKLARIRHQAAQRECELRSTVEQAHQAAASTATRLVQVLETMGDTFITLDRNWQITYQNAVSEKLNGKPRQAILGQCYWDEWPDTIGTPLETEFRRAMAENESVHFEHHIFTASGQEQWLEVHAYPADEGLNVFFHDITERRRIETRLQVQQGQLQQQLAEIETIYQSAPIGLNVLDRDLRFVRVNQRLAEINGFSMADHIGRTVRELLPELADITEAMLRPILETGVPLLNVELTGETPAQPGVQRTWVESFLPLKDGDRVIGISTVCEEITERKRIEAARQQAEADLRQAKAELEQRVAERTAELRQINADLQHSEEQLRLTLELTHIGTWDWDVVSGEVTWNENHFKLLGLNPDLTDNLYQHWRSAIHPADVEQVEQSLQDALQQRTDYQTEYRVVHSDGSLHWLVGKGCGIYNPAQEPVRMLGVIIDVSYRKQAENALELQAVITRNMAEGICVVRADNGLIVYANRKFEQMFGYNPDELTGQHVSIVNYGTEVVSPEAVNQTIRAAVLANHEATYEVHNVKKDGTPFWCSATTSVFEHPEYGTVLVAVQQDISERKQAEAKIRASLKEKELLLKEIYHRVKNNLQVIYSLLNLQSRHLTDTTALAVLKDSQSRIRAMALVHEKLYQSPDLSRIDFADYVTSLAYGLLEFYRSGPSFPILELDLQTCWLDIELAIPCGLILTELLSNSLKHAFPDHQAGKITIVSTLSEPNQITLFIRDNGIGLSPEINLKTSSSLGLQLVHNLIQQIRGQVSILPVPVGTGLEITFPIEKLSKNQDEEKGVSS